MTEEHPYILETVTPASGDVVTLDEMKAVLRFDDDAEDDLIQDQIDAATLYVEKNSGKQLLTATYDIKFCRFPCDPYGCIELPKLPLQSVASVKYVATDGTLTTLSGSNYTVQTGSEHVKGYVLPAYGLCWPSTRGYDRDVTIRFTCGFGGIDDVPETIRHQIRLLVAAWFMNRSAIACGAQSRSQLAFDTLATFNEHQEFF